MKFKGLLAGVAMLSGVMVGLQAADDTEIHGVSSTSMVRSNAVSGLRHQDNAFSLMIESYRQIQSLMIESDYEKRVQLAAKCANPKERDQVMALADQERANRLAKLQSVMAGFNTAYGASRKEEERKTGQTIASTATPETADQQLRRYVPFSPKQFNMGDNPSDLVPAGARMIYDDKRR